MDCRATIGGWQPGRLGGAKGSSPRRCIDKLTPVGGVRWPGLAASGVGETFDRG